METIENTTIENNKLIAEFMEWNYDETNDWYFTPHSVRVIDEEDSIDGRHIYDNEIPADFFEFHTSWDWLMPVVEKIEHTSAYVNIKGCAVNVSTFVETSAPTKLEATYKAVIEFIKWYNENK